LVSTGPALPAPTLNKFCNQPAETVRGKETTAPATTIVAAVGTIR
jgi:hypothetical protein